MKIVYDVEAVTQMTAACQTANNELQKAQDLLQEIKSHNDWGCKEKNTINDLVDDAKKTIRQLCESQSGFLQAVKAAEGELTGAEKSISGLFGGVESLLAKILSIPVKETVVIGAGLGAGSAFWNKIFGNGNGDIVDTVKDTVNNIVSSVEGLQKKAVIQKYNPQFNESGQLIWAEKGHPPMELIEALGGKGGGINFTTGEMTVMWPKEGGGYTVQKFQPEQAWDPFSKMRGTGASIDIIRDSFDNMTTPVQIVNFQDLIV